MAKDEINGYKLTKKWFEFIAEQDDNKPIDTALFWFIVELSNKLNWKKEFSLPTYDTMEVLGISDYRTYKKALDKLINYGFINMIQKSKNQYTANKIAFGDKCYCKKYNGTTNSTTNSTTNDTPVIDKPLNDKTFKPSKQKESEEALSNASNFEEENNESKKQDNSERKKVRAKKEKFTKPNLNEIKEYFFEKLNENKAVNYDKCDNEAEKFFDHYESNGWKVSKQPMKNWKASVRNWIRRMPEFKNQKTKNNEQPNSNEEGNFGRKNPNIVRKDLENW